MSRALAIISKDGEQLFTDFATHVYTTYGLSEVIEVHVDSTSMYFYKVDSQTNELVEMPQEEFNKLKEQLPVAEMDAAVGASRASLEQAYQELQLESPLDKQLQAKPSETIKILRGHSKDHRSDLGQIIICSVVEGAHGIPLYTKLADGNTSDRSLFAEVANEAIPVLKQVFTKVKYWVNDSAGCTQASFDSVSKHGLSIVTRATDNLVFTKQLMQQTQDNPAMLKEFLDESGQWQYKKHHGTEAGFPKAYMCTGKLFDHDVVAMVVSNPALKKTKSRPQQKAADEEHKKLIKALNKRFKCEADAKANADKLKASAEYCEVVIKGYDGKEVNASPGPVPKDPAKRRTKLVDVKVVAEVTISQSKLAEAIEQECRYVLVTTDTKRKWTPLELYNTYKRNYHIETLWRIEKNKKLFLNRFFLQNSDRIEGLAILLSIGVLAHTVMQAIIRREVANGEITILDNEDKKADPKPTFARICRYFTRANVSLTYEPHRRQKVTLHGIDDLVFDVLAI